MKYFLSIKQESSDGHKSRTVALGVFDSEKEANEWIDWLKEIYYLATKRTKK